MDVITFPENRKTTSGLQILLHGIISLRDATSYDKMFYFITSSEFNAYQMWVKLVFFYSEKISYFFTSDWYDLYFHCRIE